LELPQPGDTVQFARQVTFPEARIAEVEVKALNTPRLYPSFDESVGGVRIDFLVDSATTGFSNSNNISTTSKLKRSKIYSLLYGWRILGRIGRLPYNSEDMSVQLPEIPVPLGDTFKKDIKLYFLQGSTKDTSGIVADALNASASAGMEVSMAFVMKKCWISSIQFNGVDQSTTTPLTISAVIIPEEIFPFNPTPEISGNIAMRDSAFIRGVPNV
jgi:hypothetical protein